MNDISNYFSQQDEIKILTKQVDMVANFYRKFYKDKVANLEDRVESYRKLKHKAIQSRIKAMEGKETVVKTLLKLVLAGRIDLTNKEISEICFFEERSVIEHKSRIKKEMA